MPHIWTLAGDPYLAFYEYYGIEWPRYIETQLYYNPTLALNGAYLMISKSKGLIDVIPYKYIPFF